ncbi:MAG: rhodanese-like domain-containing protein [Bacteroidetes bacterium]|nr:rhodanese-like domain-containing protein [Bacteroidota bacterium]
MDGKNKILIIVAAFILLIILGILSVRKPDIGYQLTPREALDNALSLVDEVFPEDIVYALEDSASGYQLIDLRTPYDFLQGHIRKAVNIPSSVLLQEDNLLFLQKLDKDSVTIVLYGNNQSQANLPWMLLKQIGIENVKVLLGGYDYIKGILIDPYAVEDLPNYLVEEPAFDFASLLEINTSASGESPDNHQPEMIMPVRKKKSTAAEGGC